MKEKTASVRKETSKPKTRVLGYFKSCVIFSDPNQWNNDIKIGNANGENIN